jgi:hypothetical protein
MSSYRIVIFESQPRADSDSPTIPPSVSHETKVFEQTVPDLDVRRFVRDFNKPVRKSRAKSLAPKA